jgi:hypothetical protein
MREPCSSCENLDPVGNLRDYDWDFNALWHSPELQARRAQIKMAVSALTSRTATIHHSPSIQSI